MANDRGLVDALMARAFSAATRAPGQRPSAREVGGQLSRLAGNDRDALLAACDGCVDRFAQGEHAGWATAATYFLRPLTRSATVHSVR